MDRLEKERLALFVPGLYTYVSRYPRVSVFLLVNLAYTTTVGILYAEAYRYRGWKAYLSSDLWSHAAWYVVLFVLFFLVYEMGYIHNDTVAVRKEPHPKYRLSGMPPLSLVGASFLFRFASFSGILSYLYVARNWAYAPYFAAYAALMLVVFYVHDTVPKRYRLGTIFFLRCYRATAPLASVMALTQDIALPISIYAVAFSGYNVLSYLSVNKNSFSLCTNTQRTLELYSPRTRTLAISGTVTILALVAAGLGQLSVWHALTFSLLCTTYMVALYLVQTHSAFKSYSFS